MSDESGVPLITHHSLLITEELAERFWADAGGPPPYPRDLQAAIAYACPLGVVEIGGLSVAAVETWLAERCPRLRGAGSVQHGCRLGVAERSLRACLVARAGEGLVFVDAADPPAERRFSLAHEIAHFLADYRRPRERAAARLGPAVLAVLDGLRPPTAVERIDAVLARVPLGIHVHLLERTADGLAARAAIARAERHADQLALELLAPRAAVASALAARALPPAGSPARRAAVAALLVADFGLPPAIATAYAATFSPPEPAAAPFLRRLGLRA